MSFKKTISVLLSLITILSMFTIATAPVEAASKPTVSITKAAFDQDGELLTIVKSNKNIKKIYFQVVSNPYAEWSSSLDVPISNTNSFSFRIDDDLFFEYTNFKVRVKIKDSNNILSDWSDFAYVTMKKSLQTPTIKSVKVLKDKQLEFAFNKPINTYRIIYRVTDMKTKYAGFEFSGSKQKTGTSKSFACYDKGKYKIEMKVLNGNGDGHTILKNMYQSAWSKPVYVTVK